MSPFVLICRSWFIAMVLGSIALSAGEQSAASGNLANTVAAPMSDGIQNHKLTAFDTASLDSGAANDEPHAASTTSSDTAPLDSMPSSAPKLEQPSTRFQWKPALAQYFLEISIQHAWRFAHEEGTRDATGNGHWFQDWMKSIGETRGWDDGDGWHASYVAHPLNGGIYGFIEQQNDPLYRKVEWGDGRIYWMSRVRALAFAAIASTQWTLGPLSEASLGAEALHSSPGFIDLVNTPGLGIMEMMGEDMLDRYVIIPSRITPRIPGSSWRLGPWGIRLAASPI